MKRFYIHTGEQLNEGEEKNRSKISSNDMQQYIYEQIDFNLPLEHWDKLERSFADIWNNRLGIGGSFYWNSIAQQVYQDILKARILLTEQKVTFIVNLMLSKIEQDGGFLE